MRPALNIALVLATCADDSTPRGAFERMADAAQSESVGDLFDALDDESRDAVSGLHGAQARIGRLLRRDFLTEEREGVPGRWRLGAEARDARSVFAAWCREYECLAEVTDRLSAPVRVDIDGAGARVLVRKGRSYPFSRSRRGRWGLSLFRDRLRRWNVEVHRDLESIAHSAGILRRLR